MKSIKQTLLLIILISIFSISLFSEVVEKIYAVVNNEVITKSDFENTVNMQIQEYNKTAEKKKYTLTKKEKLEALNMLIESKLILSKAKLKDYDVKNDVKLWVNQIKKENNFSSDKEFADALKSQGIDMTLEEFLESRKLQVMQQRLIQDEVSRNISIDNSEIMEYFKKNKKDYMTKMTIELNCILLNKENTDSAFLEVKMKEISEKLKKDKFKSVAKTYSQLTTDPETNFYLGKFKSGELNEKIEEIAMKLKRDAYSDWIETDNAWYIVQLVERNDPKFVEYKSVRGKIQNEIFMKRRQIELKKYVEVLRKNSYVEVFIKF